jgi:hypothetical protein
VLEPPPRENLEGRSGRGPCHQVRDPCCYTDAQVISTGRLWAFSLREKEVWNAEGFRIDSAILAAQKACNKSSMLTSHLDYILHGVRSAIRFAILIEWYDDEGTGLAYKQERNQDFVEYSVSGSVLQAVTEPSNILQIVLQSTVLTSYVACRLLSTDSGKTCNS